MSYSQSWLEDPTRARGLLVVASVRNVTSNSETSLYLSTMPYITTDNVAFSPVIANDVEITESIDVKGGSIGITFGDLEIYNPNGEYDDWMDPSKYNWSNRSIKIYYGDPAWNYSLSDLDTLFYKVYDGVIDECKSRGRGVVNLILRDKLELLNVALTESTVGNTGVWASGQTNQDNIKPLVFGEVHNMSPTLVDPSTLTYMYCGSGENRLNNSQNFDNTGTWIGSQLDIVSNIATAPDGTLTADALLDRPTNTSHYLAQTTLNVTSGLAYTFSIFVKAGSKTTLGLLFTTTNSAFSTQVLAIYNLTTEKVTRQDSGILSTSLKRYDNGWYRASVTLTASATVSTGRIHIYSQESDTTLVSYLGDPSTPSVYFWGAQWEQSNYATEYNISNITFTSRASTATFVNSSGIIATSATNTPRFSYNPENLAIPPAPLLEVARTNLILQSEGFSTTPWTSSTGVLVSANTVVSPDGTQDAETLQESSGTTIRHWVAQSLTIAANTAYTFSVFVKAGSRNFAGIVFGKSGTPFNRAGLIINLTTGQKIADYLNGTVSYVHRHRAVQYPNGWWRVAVTVIMDASSTDGYVEVWPSIDGTSSTYLGAGGTVNVWGAQLEAGYYASSYIPTTTATVPRSADVYSLSSFYNNPAELLIEVRDNGYPIYRYDRDTSGATVNTTDGTFTLKSPAAGTITCSVQGVKSRYKLIPGTGTSVSTSVDKVYINTIPDVIMTLVTGYGTGALNYTDIDLVNFNSVLNYLNTALVDPTCGYVATDRVNVLQVIQELAASVGHVVYCNRNGLLQLVGINQPYYSGETTSVSTITESDILLKSLNVVERLPAIGAVKLGYAKNWTIQQNLTTYITEQLKKDYTQEWFITTATDNNTIIRYRLTSDPQQKNTYLVNTNVAASESERLLAYYKTPRTIFGFTGSSRLMNLKLGQQVLLTHSRFGLSAGKTGQVIKITPRWCKGLIDVEVIV